MKRRLPAAAGATLILTHISGKKSIDEVIVVAFAQCVGFFERLQPSTQDSVYINQSPRDCNTCYQTDWL
jgi:hypothetical protein